MRLSSEFLESIKGGGNLLAFSNGVDSTALYFLLKEHDIEYDIAIIDYSVREQSKKEVANAKALAKIDNKICYILSLCYIDSISSYVLESKETHFKHYTMQTKEIESNFECRAREIRYDFFYYIMRGYGYRNLILAHHLDDKIEWFFMQLSRGAGLNSLLGFDYHEIRYRDNTAYNIFRPLINFQKEDLLSYNKANGLKYFIDSSNASHKHERNIIRENLKPLLDSKRINGIRKSFEYLQSEKKRLYPTFLSCMDKNLIYCKRASSIELELHIIDTLAKRLGYLISARQRVEIKTMIEGFNVLNMHEKDLILGGKIAIGINNKYIFVGIFHDDLNDVKIPKKIREQYRIDKIPKKIRKVMYASENIM